MNPSYYLLLILFAFCCAPVFSQNTFRDEFNAVSYANNDGTDNFIGSWQESGETTSPTAGQIRVISGRLRLQQLTGQFIFRNLDLTGATSATVTMDIDNSALGDEILSFFMRRNDGVLLILQNYVAGIGSVSFNVPADYIFNNSAIGFYGLGWDFGETSFIDNITVTATFPPSNPSITVEDVSLAENGGPAIFTVTHNNIATGSYSVDYSITAVSATEGVDYTTVSGLYTGTLSFTGAVGDTETISVDITADGLPELNETYTIQFTATTDNAVDITDTATGTIEEVENTRAYEERYAMNIEGNFKTLSNTNLECIANCPVAPVSNNPSVVMGYVDIDTDGTTVNSSSATLTLPVGANIVWAGLYWGGLFSSSRSGITNPLGMTANEVKFRIPGATNYTLVNASAINSENSTFSGWTSYLAFADVTALVQSGGSGDYFTADIALATGSNLTGPYGGWNLVVIYEDPFEKTRNIAVWDGFDFFGFGANETFTITGLLTPSSGTFESHAAYFAFDGEADRTGDFLSIEGTPLTNGLNPIDNTLNGTISAFGVDSGARNPNFNYNWGIDSDIFNASGLVANNATEMDVTLGSSVEGVWGGVFVTSNEIAFPTVASKVFTPNIINIGESATVTIQLDNPSNGVTLTNLTLNDPFPTGMLISNVPNASSSCGGTITAIPGDNAFNVSGINLPAGGSCTFTFDVVTSTYGTFDNSISPSDLTNDQNVPIYGASTGTLTVNIKHVITNRRITYRVNRD